MNRALQIAHLALLIAATSLIGVAAWQGLLLARKLDSTVMLANQTLVNINRPCSGPHGPDACGTLAQINKVAIAAGDVANASKVQVEQSGALIKSTTANIDAIGATVKGAVIHLSGTADALTETAHGATAAIHTTNETIAGLQPVERAATASIATLSAGFAATNSDLDHFITAPALSATLANVQSMTADGHRITKDAADEADKLVHPPVKKLTFWGGVDASLMYFHSHIAPPIL